MNGSRFERARDRRIRKWYEALERNQKTLHQNRRAHREGRCWCNGAGEKA